MPLRFCLLLALGLGAVLLLTEAAGLAGLGWAPHHAVLEPWTSCAAGGGLCFPLVFASSRGRRWLLGLSTVAMALVVLSVLAAGGDGADAGAAAGWGPGLVACGALGWRARGRGRLAGRLLAAWALLPLATTVKPFFTEGTTALMRGTVDAQIARLDALTGTEPAAVMATLAERHPSLDALLTLAYLLLPVAMTSVAALQARRRAAAAGAAARLPARQRAGLAALRPPAGDRAGSLVRDRLRGRAQPGRARRGAGRDARAQRHALHARRLGDAVPAGRPGARSPADAAWRAPSWR